MTNWEGERAITLVSACMWPDGFPHFALSEVSVTADEFANGVHYAIAEQRLLALGYEEPFVHFSEEESPGFLIPALKATLAAAWAMPTSPTVPSEEEP